MEILNKLVSEAREKVGGDCEAAKKEAWRKLKANPKLYRQICDPLAQMAIAEAVELDMRRDRAPFWNGSLNGANAGNGPNNEPRRGYVEGLREAAILDIYFYPLRSGKPLGDGTYDDIDTERSWFFAYAKANTERYKWFDSMMSYLDSKNRKKVRDVLTRQKLEELRDQAKIGGADEQATI